MVEAATVRATTKVLATLRPHHVFPTREAHTSDDVLEYPEATRRFQRRYLLDVLAEAVRRLGLTRSQLYNLIAIFELKRPKDHPPP